MLILPQTGLVKFRFPVDLRHVNKYSICPHFSMPNLKHELTRLYVATVYATFELSHGYLLRDGRRKFRMVRQFIMVAECLETVSNILVYVFCPRQLRWEDSRE